MNLRMLQTMGVGKNKLVYSAPIHEMNLHIIENVKTFKDSTLGA